MKKIALLALGASMFIATADAQKQSGGENNLEVQFAPLSGTPISIGGIRYRKFSSDGTSAWRINLFVGKSDKNSSFSSKEITQQSDTAGNAELSKTTSGLNF